MGTWTQLLSCLLMASSTTAAHASPRQQGYGLIKFEDQQPPHYDPTQGGLVSFEDQGHPQGNTQPFRFDNTQNYQENSNPENSLGFDNDQNKPINFGQANGFPEHIITGLNTGVTFQDDNEIEGQKGQKKRKKRRRRRPRQQLPAPGAYPGRYPAPGVSYLAPGVGYPAPGADGYPANGVGYPAPGVDYPVPGAGYPAPYGQNPYGGHSFAPGSYRPVRRPRLQSAAAGALAAVTEALASIARYDDYQCVPRLLCEAAGGGAPGASGASGTGAGSGLLQSIAGLQPLLTLLSAQNGISASPLFVFGRAVLLGMASRGAPAAGAPAAACRYAYPLCPADPEQLVHYLNNHNGGFFRFFGAPQRPNPAYGLQDLQQFYSQLAVPGQPGQYGFYQPSANAGTSPDYGYNHPDTGYPASGAQQFGLYNGIPNQHDPNYTQRPPSVNYPNYGANYPYNGQQNYGSAKVGFRNNEFDSKDVETNKIQRRIQNVKSEQYGEDNFRSYIVDRNKNSKWLFPNTNLNVNNMHSNKNNKRDSNQFMFPQENFKADDSDTLVRKAKGFSFPGAQSNRDLDVYAYSETIQSNDDVYSHHQDRASAAQPETPQDGREEGIEVVYIVRGDGDPKNPEVVRLRPGQTIQTIQKNITTKQFN